MGEYNGPWPKEKKEKLIELSKLYKYKKIALLMHTTIKSIYNMSSNLNLDVEREKRIWTTEDDEVLTNMWGREPVEKIAETLRRSVNAIRERATFLNLGRMIDACIDYINVKTISQLFGISEYPVLNTWVSRGLVLRKIKLSSKIFYYFISLNSLLKFIEKNQDLWDSNYLEKDIFGKEPEWLIQKREKDKMNPPSKYINWTLGERKVLKSIYLKGGTYKEVTDEYNKRFPDRKRSGQAIVFQITTNRDYYGEVERKGMNLWKREEVEILESNPNMSIEELVELTGRTESAVRGKLYYIKMKKKVNK